MPVPLTAASQASYFAAQKSAAIEDEEARRWDRDFCMGEQLAGDFGAWAS
jgi:hypothetical protein